LLRRRSPAQAGTITIIGITTGIIIGTIGDKTDPRLARGFSFEEAESNSCDRQVASDPIPWYIIAPGKPEIAGHRVCGIARDHEGPVADPFLRDAVRDTGFRHQQ
jgi:hypothetical protein